MTKSRTIIVLCVGFVFELLNTANATTVSYDVTNIGSNIWEYTYTINNDSLSIYIEEVTIFFTLGDYENIFAGSTPADWDPLVIQPDPGIPSDGFYDALALSVGIAPGDSLGGFTVRFDYLGTGSPGSQAFEIVDPLIFSTIDSGATVQAVPLPAGAWLFLSGLLALIGSGVRHLKLTQE